MNRIYVDNFSAILVKTKFSTLYFLYELIWRQSASEYTLPMPRKLRPMGWKNKTQRNCTHIWNWNFAIVSAVTINVGRKIISFCLLWAAVEYGGWGSLLIQALQLAMKVASWGRSPIGPCRVNSAQKSPPTSTHCKPIQGYFFFCFGSPSNITGIERSNDVFACLHSDSVCHLRAATLPVFHLANLNV